MQPAKPQTDQPTDIASSVVAAMRQLGVMGIPQNYEIFYEALTGSNPALSLDVVSLSARPSQAEIDAIGQKYFAHHHQHNLVDQAREVLAKELEDIAGLLRSERNHIEKYGKILDETSSGLGSRSMSQELLQKVAGAMSAATTSTIDHGRQVANALSDKSAELESVKSKLEEYKKLADTDPLTQIPNRRAFDKEITHIYDSKKDVMFKALILADIDRFKNINDRYGHPVGDRIIQMVAEIFRTSILKNMFVARTGGEEFALIAEGLSEDATFEIAERIRLLIEQTPFTNAQAGIDYGPVTISMGICMASDANGADELYAHADRALYRSKVLGRNKVTRFSSLPSSGPKNWLLYKKD